jgi:hypothetical protein
MAIAAKYEDGVFKPLEEVKLTEGTRVEMHVTEQRPKRPKSVREFAAFGMWACANRASDRLIVPMAYLIDSDEA